MKSEIHNQFLRVHEDNKYTIIVPSSVLTRSTFRGFAVSFHTSPTEKWILRYMKRMQRRLKQPSSILKTLNRNKVASVITSVAVDSILLLLHQDLKRCTIYFADTEFF